MQAGIHAVLRVWARQSVDCTPGRPLVRPGGRRTPAGTGVPRSRGRTTLGVHDPLVTWLKPQPRPSWLARETWAALPEALVRREVRDHRGRPGFRPRQITLVTTRLDADSSRVADRAALYRPRGQVETAPAQLKTTRPMDVWPGQTVPGVLKELTLLAIVDNLVRRVMGPSAGLQQLEVERSSGRDALRWLSAPSTEIP